MNRFLLALSLAVGITCTTYALVHADGSATVDAGPGAGNVVPAPSGVTSAPVVVAPITVVTPAPVVLPDPTVAPLDAASDLQKLYRSGAWMPLAILTAFFLLVVLQKKWVWLSAGNRKVYVAAAIGGLAILAVPASQGTTPNLAMVVAALGAALALWTNPKPPQ